jgi:U3 small nucleolar RNA-associated protein 21
MSLCRRSRVLIVIRVGPILVVHYYYSRTLTSSASLDLDGIEPIGEPEFQDIYTTPEQLGEELLTLSLMPRSRWQTLLNLDIIRARNKPKEAPKAPEQAPFFLPTVTSLDDGLGTRFDIAPKEDDSASKSTTRLDLQSAFVESEFTRCLGQEKEGGRCKLFAGSV